MTIAQYLTLEHQSARTLSDAAPFFKLLFPVLTVLGPVVFFRYAWLGIVKRQTRMLGRNRYHQLSNGWVTGWPAVFLGIAHFMMGSMCLALLAPISAAMWGLW
jgi:hypothetical protein